MRMTAVRRRTTVEQVLGGQGQTRNQDQVSTDVDGGERRARGEGQEVSGDAIYEKSVKITEELEGSATE